MSRKKIAFIFPGQGAQYPGMGRDFAQSFALARETFEEADDLLQEKLSRVIFEGPEELLKETQYSQLGIFITSVAILRVVQEQLPDWIPTFASGLSLGEYSALFASGKLGFAQTLFLVRERARLMNEACEKSAGAMAAVLGLNGDQIDAALKGIDGVWVANYNCPGQIVISGTIAGVERGAQILKEKGAKRVIPLTVHGAFHSPLMQSAQEGLKPFVEKTPLQITEIGLVMNVPGAVVHDLSQMKSALIQQVTSSIRWEEGIRSMDGVEFFCEMGCGKTLAGLNRKIGVSAPTYSIEKVADLEEIGMLCNS